MIATIDLVRLGQGYSVSPCANNAISEASDAEN
jgi:hypothetical protein